MSKPFFIWTMRRTGGTSLTDLLMSMSEYRTIEQEPFQLNREFGFVLKEYREKRDSGKKIDLTDTFESIFSDKPLIKHCYEIVGHQFNHLLMEYLKNSEYKHIFLMRKDEESRILSLMLAYQTKVWGKHGSKEIYEMIRSGQRKLDPINMKLLERELKNSVNATEMVRKDLKKMGIEVYTIYFEELYAGEKDERREHLKNLLRYLEFTEDEIRSKSDEIDFTLFARSQNSQDIVKYIPNLDEVKKMIRETEGQEIITDVSSGSSVDASNDSILKKPMKIFSLFKGISGSKDSGPAGASAEEKGSSSNDDPWEINLEKIFSRQIELNYGNIHRLVKRKINEKCGNSVSLTGRIKGCMSEVDLEGKVFILDRPLKLHHLDLITLKNGTLIAGPDFPEGEFLIDVKGTHGIQLRGLYLECSKRASGISFEKFFRVRVEDCYIVHQKEYGIYSSPTGANHELEIFKCHISEYHYGDGRPSKKSTYGIIPEFDKDENRQSVGVYLGQADNIVADCNINFCRVGIFTGMRANRIHGNHITAGATRDLEIFKGIELNHNKKSSAMIVNNYIDNCCLWINCNDQEYNSLRNYVHVTDNLFYRGFDHPRKRKREFHHIIVNPLAVGSLLSNIHITDNLFYNQPENLEQGRSRIITPVKIVNRKIEEKVYTNIDHTKIHNVVMNNNHFTNNHPTFVKPMGTRVSKTLKVDGKREEYTLSFGEVIPFGVIREAQVTVLGFEGEEPPIVAVRKVAYRKVILYVRAKSEARVLVSVSAEANTPDRYDYNVH